MKDSLFRGSFAAQAFPTWFQTKIHNFKKHIFEKSVRIRPTRTESQSTNLNNKNKATKERHEIHSY